MKIGKNFITTVIGVQCLVAAVFLPLVVSGFGAPHLVMQICLGVLGAVYVGLFKDEY